MQMDLGDAEIDILSKLSLTPEVMVLIPETTPERLPVPPRYDVRDGHAAEYGLCAHPQCFEHAPDSLRRLKTADQVARLLSLLEHRARRRTRPE